MGFWWSGIWTWHFLFNVSTWLSCKYLRVKLFAPTFIYLVDICILLHKYEAAEKSLFCINPLLFSFLYLWECQMFIIIQLNYLLQFWPYPFFLVNVIINTTSISISDAEHDIAWSFSALMIHSSKEWSLLQAIPYRNNNQKITILKKVFQYYPTSL